MTLDDIEIIVGNPRRIRGSGWYYDMLVVVLQPIDPPLCSADSVGRRKRQGDTGSECCCCCYFCFVLFCVSFVLFSFYVLLLKICFCLFCFVLFFVFLFVCLFVCFCFLCFVFCGKMFLIFSKIFAERLKKEKRELIIKGILIDSNFIFL